MGIQHIQIDVQGIVQGVGFRPFVYGIATRYKLVGWVYNHGTGVSIAIQGPSTSITAFLSDLQLQLPPLANITSIETLSLIHI